MTKNLDCRLNHLFYKSKRIEDIKKSLKHYLITIKRYTILQIQKNVAELLGLPRPSEILDSKTHKIVNFKARNFYFWENACFFNPITPLRGWSPPHFDLNASLFYRDQNYWVGTKWQLNIRSLPCLDVIFLIIHYQKLCKNQILKHLVKIF